jgi:hypothetical protein
MKAAFYYYFWISFYLYINKVGKLRQGKVSLSLCKGL